MTKIDNSSESSTQCGRICAPLIQASRQAVVVPNSLWISAVLYELQLLAWPCFACRQLLGGAGQS